MRCTVMQFIIHKRALLIHHNFCDLIVKPAMGLIARNVVTIFWSVTLLP